MTRTPLQNNAMQENEKEREYRNHPKQRSALHVWLTKCAQVLADGGITMKVILEQCPEVQPTMILLKEQVYKPMLKAMEGYESTEDQRTTDVETVRREFENFFAEKFGVELPPWPSNR